MELSFKIIVCIMLLALSVGYIETRCAHKAAVQQHVDLSDKIRDFVTDKLEHVVIPNKNNHKH